MAERNFDWDGLPKDWYSLYQWQPTSQATYLERIAERLADEFPSIALNKSGLRQSSFRTDSHRGQISLNTDISQLTEKRLVRALFNSRLLPVLGTAVDYEVPLKNTAEAPHGDIDLICHAGTSCLCLEAKKPDSTESLLKPILQAYTYTSLVATRRHSFLADFGLPETTALAPGVLTFTSATSGRQLAALDNYPNTRRLITIMNERLSEAAVQPMRFFTIDNPATDFTDCLVASEDESGDLKVTFRPGFTLSITEHPIE